MAEIDFGQEFLKDILDIFPVEITVAIGKKAEIALNQLGLDCRVIRHPARGGKREFEAGIRELLGMHNLFLYSFKMNF